MKTTLETTKRNSYKKPEIKALISQPYVVEGYSNERWSRKKNSYADTNEETNWENEEIWNK